MVLGKFLLLVLICGAQQVCQAANQPVTINTAYGDVLGYQTDTARVFYGIPFAQPPVDTLR